MYGNDESQSSIDKARKVNIEFLKSLIEIHGQLNPNQRLLLEVSVAGEEPEKYGEMNGYAGILVDAPHDFVDTQLKKRGIEEVTAGIDFLGSIIITIPPDICPEEVEDGRFEPAYRAAHTQEVARSYLDVDESYAYLIINLSSDMFFGLGIVVHPSLIRSIEVVTLNENEVNNPLVEITAGAVD